MHTAAVWVIAAGAIAGVLFRPRGWPEAVWACLGAVLLVTFGLLSIPQAGAAVAKGSDVYLFLTGMMLLSELARREGVFDWLASLAAMAARGSAARLFALIYLVGIAVTVFLSNDATAVVLTPAVYTAVKKARAPALPYLFICAFIANAASFVLPISNPANLVVYGKNLPPLVPWLHNFLLPSVASIAVTYMLLRWLSRKELRNSVERESEQAELSHEGRFAAGAIAVTGVVLLVASAFALDLGLPTFVAAAVAVLTTTRIRVSSIRGVVAQVPWSVLPLVAGLFVLVEGINQAGALPEVSRAFRWCAGQPVLVGDLSAAFGIAALSNLMNNLPSGLLAAGALHAIHLPAHTAAAVLVGVDLGPNLSVTGSLATVLWLIALRREGEHVSAWTFFKTGLLLMPPALLLATVAIALTSR